MLLVTGATSHIGRRVSELLSSQVKTIRLMTRDPEKAPKLANVEVAYGDFAEPQSLAGAFDGVDTALIVSASGEPGQRAQLHDNAFRAAAGAHVGHVVYLSLQGASPKSRYPYSRDHYQSETFLAATGLPHTILRNAFYMDMFLNKFDEYGLIFGPAGEGRGAFVSREDVARTAAAVVLDGPAGILEVTGPETLNVADVAERLSRLCLRQLKYQNEEASFLIRQLKAQKKPEGEVALEVGWFEAIAAGELDHVTNTVARYTGRQPYTFDEYFKTFPGPLAHLIQRNNTNP